MKKLQKTSWALAAFLLLGACAPTEKHLEKPAEKTVSALTIEPHKGRINTETTIARTLKYNLDAIKQSSVEKFLGQSAREHAFANLLKLRENQSAASSLKELDFAILYAAVNSETSPDKIDALFNRVIGQNLVQGALKAHKNELYNHKKIFDVRRKIRRCQKQLVVLMKKNTDKDLEYKKSLEDAIDKLKLIEQKMNQNSADFRTLVKIDPPKTEPEGRLFFDSLNLPPQIKLEDYQAAALAGRQELDNFEHGSLAKVSQAITAEYPDNEDRIKGFYLQDAAYLKNLAVRGDALASKLLQTALDYQKAGKTKKKTLHPKLGETLNNAVYTQVELAYSLALKAAADFEAQKSNLRLIRQEIQKTEKTGHSDSFQQLKLLQLQLDLLENENIADQILAEKAMTVTSLQFYAGQLVITPALLQKDIPSLAAFFKDALSQKIPVYTETTSPVLSQDETAATHAWAHSENWLEEVLAEPLPLKKQTQPLMSRPLSNRIDDNRYTVMQLGAYIEQSTAESDWQKLSVAYPELAKYTPQYETTDVTGIKLFRLIIKSASGGFRDICAKLRAEGKECILRD